jgi:hypothetical protein
MTTQQPAAPPRPKERFETQRDKPATRYGGLPALLFLAAVLLLPAGVSSLELTPAGGATLDTTHMTDAQKLQAHLDSEAVISLVGLIVFFAGGSCLVVAARRNYRWASRRGSSECWSGLVLPVTARRGVIPIHSYRATTAALRSARLAEAAVAFGLSEPGKPGSCHPADTDQLLDRLLELAG